jgi:hypothetical protein
MTPKKQLDTTIAGLLIALIIIALPIILWPTSKKQIAPSSGYKSESPKGLQTALEIQNLTGGLVRLSARFKPTRLFESVNMEWHLPSGSELIEGSLVKSFENAQVGVFTEWSIQARLPSSEAHKIEMTVEAEAESRKYSQRLASTTEAFHIQRDLSSQTGRTRSSELPVSF